MSAIADSHPKPVPVSRGILAALIGFNLVWSANPAMGKILLTRFSPSQTALLRYGGALVAYIAVVGVAGGARRFGAPAFARPRGRKDWLLILLLGFMTFCFSPLLGLTGLAGTQATDGALIVAIEPMFTVLLCWIFLKEGPTPAHFVSFTLALGGFALLAGLSFGGFSAHLVADSVILLSLAGEAAFSVLGRKLMVRYPPMSVFGSALLAGVFWLLVCLPFLPSSPPPQAVPSASPLWLGFAAFWVGPIGTGLGYLFWMLALRTTSVATLVLTLFVQPVFGAFWGLLFLGERLGFRQGVGAVLILGAVAVQVIVERRSQPTPLVGPLA